MDEGWPVRARDDLAFELSIDAARSSKRWQECYTACAWATGSGTGLDLSSLAMKSFFLVLALLTTILWLGCGDDRPPGTAGNDSSLVGGPCMNNSECDQGLCEDGFRFPGGMCTVSCGSSGDCPQGSSCGELDTGWVCLVNCRDTPDCRTDYLCESVTEAGTNQSSSVSLCIGPAR